MIGYEERKKNSTGVLGRRVYVSPLMLSLATCEWRGALERDYLSHLQRKLPANAVTVTATAVARQLANDCGTLRRTKRDSRGKVQSVTPPSTNSFCVSPSTRDHL
jgi:hypothetical protein